MFLHNLPPISKVRIVILKKLDAQYMWNIDSIWVYISRILCHKTSVAKER